MRLIRSAAIVSGALLLSGCNMVLLQPGGDVAMQQRNVLVASTLLMLLIIVPVMMMTALFAWKFRQSNAEAVYRPDWHHSTALEVAIWSAPLAIIVALGALTWVSTHVLDPYRPIGRIEHGRPVPAGTKPLRVQAVALDWKWLFIYPDLGIATVNQMAAPLDTPIDFEITSDHMMNSFFIPALAGQIYAMPGMETKLHAVMNKPGDYAGFSANYTGAGFSDMNFTFRSVDQAGFQQWVDAVKAHGGALDQPAYLQLEKPSEREPIHYYSTVAPRLFDRIANECAEPGKMCVSEMMRIDAKGGTKPVENGAMQMQDTQHMVMNQHGGQGGEVGPGAPQAPPSRRRPVQPDEQTHHGPFG